MPASHRSVAPSGLLDERSFRWMLRRATLALSLSLGLPILALLALILFLLRSADWVDHTDQVIAEANRVENLLVTMQSSFRGHAMTREESYMAPYRAARESLTPALRSLEKKVSDNPSQVEAVARLQSLAWAWVEFADRALLMRDAERDLAAMLARGTPLMNAARDQAMAVIAEEERLRAERSAMLDWVATGLFTVLALAALAGVPALVIWLRRLLHTITASHRQALTETARRAGQLEVTMRSIGDAVVATDAAGRVQFLNPAAEHLTGWSGNEAEGRALDEIFEIYSEETGEPAENPVTRVLRENVVLGLANHTVLRARDGRETPIEDSAAPIRDEAGEPVGVILVFHDVSEKRQVARRVEESERRLRFLDELGEATRPLAEAEEIMAETTRRLGEHLRVSRCAYAEVEPESGAFTILRDYTDGCGSVRGDYELAQFGPRAVEDLEAGGTLVLRDVPAELASDPGAEAFRAIDIEAIVCCPLNRERGLRAMLAVHQTRPREWQQWEIVLVQEVAERAWATIERARVEEALRGNEALKTAILDTSLDGFILMSHRGMILDWNPAAEKIFGRTPEEAVGRSLADTIVPERLREAHWTGLSRYLESGKARILGRRIEVPGMRADGSEFPAEISICRIAGTEPPLFAGYVRDISERKEAEAAVAEASARVEASALAVAEGSERFRLLAEVVSLQVWTAEIDGQLDFGNQECFDYFGARSDEDILGSAWVQFVHPDDLEVTARAWQAALATGERYEMEFRLRRGDGEYRWFLVRAEAMRDAEGKIVKWFGTNTDIHALKLAQGEAERASRAKDNFLAALSHELRTPLTPVLMIAGSLRGDDRLPEDAREQLGVLERNIALEARLIDDLLDLTRISRGKLALRPQPCDAHSLIGLAIEIVRDDAQAKGITFQRDLAAHHSGLIADPARFQQVIWNLLRNAVKFTPAGGTITIRTRDQASDRLCIEVSDTGIGIQPEGVEKIFLPFDQGGHEGDHRFGGIGLGLAIAHAIVDLHGGTIVAESEGVGKGATFTVELPNAGDPPQGAADEPDGETNLADRVAKLSLLIVEDHEPTLRVLTRLLTRAGHRVVNASTVASALAAAEAGTFDLVISDLGLPDGTGVELMMQLRDRYHLRGIALSGYGMEEDIARSRAAGFQTHLIKPVDFDQLRRAIATVAMAE